MKKISILLFFIIIQNGYAQNEKVIDSLKQVLTGKIDDSTRINTLNELGWNYRSINQDTAKYFALRAIKFAEKGFEKGKIRANTLLGAMAYSNSHFDSAIYYFEKNKELSLKLKDTSSYTNTLTNLSIMYKKIGDYEHSLECLATSIKLAVIINNPSRIAKGRLNLANLYLELDKIEEAIIEGEKALNISREHKLDLLQEILNTVGILYDNAGKYQKSIDYLNESLEINKKSGNLKPQSLNLQNLANTYYSWGKLDLSYQYYLKALTIKNKLGDQRSIAKTNYAIGKVLFSMENYSLSIVYLKDGMSYFDTYGNLIEKKTINEILAKCYEKLKNYSKAYSSLSETRKLSDSLNKIEQIEIIEEVNTKYQTQQKENEILNLTNENLQKEASLTQSRYTIFGVLGALLLVIGLGYFYWNKKKQAHKLALLENSVKSSEAEKSRIGKELHDGIAGTLMKLVHDSETAQIQLSHQLLQTYNEVRNLSHQLDNSPMHKELFFERVLDIIPDSTKKQGFKFEITPRHLQIKEPHGTHIFRILQELIANNLKYAKASKTAIKIDLKNDILKLAYSDNGIGTSEFKKGNGFKNMEDRLTLMNGTLQVETQQGFSATFTIPYTN